jgi:NADH:ubiquinone oxidoreductase subunit 3 (subunit A)
MNALTFFIFFVTLLVVVLLIVNQLISVHKPNAEKVSTYECGFTGIGDTRQRFSVQFFLVAILFLIIDLEVILLFPFAVAIYQISAYGFWIMVIFVLILTVGLVFELGSGALYFTSKASSNHSTSKPLNPLYKGSPLF